ncbi:MAG: F0F1 ATP synthase subunit delta [Chloroflexi bacterium]|nr:F0F1 ATP synthase subunit delta [Chloroflexota bacterium]
MARPTPAARRYAEAGFELALRDHALEAWRDGLNNAAALVAEPRVRSVLEDPGRPFEERAQVIDGLLGARVPAHVGNLIRLLAKRGRLEILPLVAREYQRLLNRQRGIVEATVTSAAPLDAAERDALEARIRAMTGSQVDLRTVVDPALIGGLTVRVGDTLLDASVRGRLERLREQLVAGVR